MRLRFSLNVSWPRESFFSHHLRMGNMSDDSWMHRNLHVNRQKGIWLTDVERAKECMVRSYWDVGLHPSFIWWSNSPCFFGTTSMHLNTLFSIKSNHYCEIQELSMPAIIQVSYEMFLVLQVESSSPPDFWVCGYLNQAFGRRKDTVKARNHRLFKPTFHLFLALQQGFLKGFILYLICKSFWIWDSKWAVLETLLRKLCSEAEQVIQKK